MPSHTLLAALVFSFLLVDDVRSSSKVYTHNLLQAIQETVHEIQLELRKKDRLLEVGKLFEVDKELDKLNKKLGLITSINSDEIHASDAPYKNADEKLSKYHADLNQIKANFELAEDRLAKLEQRQIVSNREINEKLEKMIDLMTTLYKKNKDNEERPGYTARSTGGNYASQQSVSALMENFQEFERKFNEELTVIKVSVANDINYVRNLATECESPQEQTDEEGDDINFGDYGDLVKTSRSRSAPPDNAVALEELSATLNHTKDKIKREVSTSLRDLDARVAGIAFHSNRCRQPVVDAAESRTVEKRAKPPIDLNPQCTPRSQNLKPQSCAALFHAGERCQGTYLIYFDGNNPELTYCDMINSGGGWTVIMKRYSMSRNGLNFSRGWLDYTNGFGDPKDEFYIGNEQLHFLSQQGQQEVDVLAEASDRTRINLRFSQFSVGGREARYRLRLGIPVPGYDGPLAQSLRQHSAHPFSTHDQDSRRGQCGPPPVGGWWHVCRGSGLQFTGPELRWFAWQQHIPLRQIQLMVRPKDFNLGASK